MNYFNPGRGLFIFGFLFLLYVMYTWWRDIVREGANEGEHTNTVQLGLRMGMIFFIISEVMFFLAFFWAFFHTSTAPVSEIGAVWPPKAIEAISPWGIPLLNTLILLASGATVTWAHEAIIYKRRQEALRSFLYTIIYAVYFTTFQVFEYYHSGFAMADGIYGSVFYMATGFHGFHVFVGTCFLITCAARLFFYQFSIDHHFGFEAAAWYWHFVDVVWLFLFVSVYWWGG